MVPFVEAGSVRPLAVSGDRRSPALPQVPTISEAGMPRYRAVGWFGLMAPAGTPRPVIDKLAGAVREALASNEVVTAWRPQGIDPLSGGPEDFARHIASESKRWGDVTTAAGLKK
jgi:tripartite-type tricarboxylate transporter receptor subunit TctC